jgi:ABC-type phosphate/phosphonate transport system substrate-binding protein
MNKRNIIILVVVFMVIPAIRGIIASGDRDLSDERYEVIVQAIVSSPKAAKLKQDDQDITSEFLDKYKVSIENEDYSEAIEFLRENDISIGISINSRNEFLMEGME